MRPEELLTSEELHAQLERPLIIGIIVVYLIHLFGVARYGMPVLAPREQRRFLAAITAAFAAFAMGMVVVYEWVLPWLAESYYEDVMRTLLPLGMYVGGFPSQAAWLCFGSAALCEIPVLTFVLGRFGFRRLQKRAAGYALILLLSATSPPTADPLPFVWLSLSFVALYEVSLGILHLKGFRGQLDDDQRYSY